MPVCMDRDSESCCCHLDTSGLDAADEAAVVDTVGAADRVDPHNPELAEVALLLAAVTVGKIRASTASFA